MRGAQLFEYLAVAPHQRDQRARRRRVGPQAIGVGEQVTLERRARQVQRRRERRVHRLRDQLGLGADARGVEDAGDLDQVLALGDGDGDQLVGGAAHQRVEDLPRRRRRVDDVAPGLEPSGDAALAGVQAKDRRPLEQACRGQQVGDLAALAPLGISISIGPRARPVARSPYFQAVCATQPIRTAPARWSPGRRGARAAWHCSRSPRILPRRCPGRGSAIAGE